MNTTTGLLKQAITDWTNEEAKHTAGNKSAGTRTFIELAAKLRQLTDGKIYLYVTHGIFSKGAEVFDGLIDGIFTTNLMGAKHPLITEISA